MNKTTDIQSTKEFELARHVSIGINYYSFSPKVFAAAIPHFHRTLQQKMWRIIVECIKVYADENYKYDDRNEASHLEAKQMMEYLRKYGRNIPLI